MKNRILVAAILAFSLFGLPKVLAQPQADSESQNMQNHVITVSRGGDAIAKPDLGIMVMTIHSSAPIAEEAVAENGRKAKAVESALTALGYTSQGYKITSVTFGQAGGPRYGPSQSEIVAYEASQYVYVFFEGADLSDVVQLTEKTAAVIEGLRKAGAVPANTAMPMGPQMQGSLITYTIKDSAAYEKQALQKAIARARDAAQDVATGMGVQITGVRNIRTGYLMGNVGRGNIALEGLSYSWYSTKSDEITIRANATVEYDFK
jgi:uncharacterized protein YggE